MWRRKPGGSENNADPYKPIQLKWNSYCAKCALRLPVRSKAYHDPRLRRVLCTACYKLIKAGRHPVAPQSSFQESIDEYKRLRGLPKRDANQEERMTELLEFVRWSEKPDRVAITFLAAEYGLAQHDSFVCIPIKYQSNCHNCEEHLPAGVIAAWDKAAHRMWCLGCASANYQA